MYNPHNASLCNYCPVKLMIVAPESLSLIMAAETSAKLQLLLSFSMAVVLCEQLNPYQSIILILDGFGSAY